MSRRGRSITREKPWMCVGCGYVMDAASPADPRHHAAPVDGSLSLCMNCGGAYTREGGKWRPLTLTEWQTLEPEEREELAYAALARGLSVHTDLARDGGGHA